MGGGEIPAVRLLTLHNILMIAPSATFLELFPDSTSLINCCNAFTLSQNFLGLVFFFEAMFHARQLNCNNETESESRIVSLI